jgi:hypothetical protein
MSLMCNKTLSWKRRRMEITYYIIKIAHEFAGTYFMSCARFKNRPLPQDVSLS